MATAAIDPLVYRAMHEDFMRNHNGTHTIEVFATILPSYLATFCTVSLQAVLLRPLSVPIRFLLEFTALVWSVVLNVTVLHPQIYAIAGCLLLLCSAIAARKLCNRTHVLAFVTQIPRRRPDYVAALRATTNLITAVCILAVDFRAFPRKLAKTETYGFALMDTGVGLYVFNNAIVDAQRFAELTAPLSGARLRRLVASVAPLLLLGVGRFVVTSSVDYQQHVSEYGVHWNFFVTLAVTRLLGALLCSLVGSARGVRYAALAVLVGHQAVLLGGVGRWVIGDAGGVSRADSWLVANREGVASVAGYVGLYLACVVLGKMMLVETDEADASTPTSDSGSAADDAVAVCKASDLLRPARRIGVTTLVVAKLAWDCERTLGVSRRLCDLGYVLWILCLAGTMTTLFMLLEVFYHCLVFWKSPAAGEADEADGNGAAATAAGVAAGSNERRPIGRWCPLVLAAINYNGLAFFLVANLLTGAVNMTFQTLLVDTAGCVFIVSVYMFVLCAIVVFLYVNEIRLKY